jgi:NADH-quinone oxidoreductase subunit L
MTRMMVMTFWGDERFREAAADEHSHDVHHAPHEPHESPWVMTVPLIVLAVLSTLGGLLGVSYALGSIVSEHPTNYIEQVLEPVVHSVPATPHNENAPASEQVEGSPASHTSLPTGPATEHLHSPEEIRQERLLAVVSVLLALGGITAGWFVFRKRPLQQMPRVLEQKYYVDEIYDAAIIRPIEVGSREGLWRLFDIGVIDGLLHALGDSIKEAGRLVRYLHAGFVRGYAAIILIGALVMIGLFAAYALGIGH